MWQSQSYPIMNHQPSHSPTIWIHLGDSYGLKTAAFPPFRRLGCASNAAIAPAAVLRQGMAGPARWLW